MRLWENKLAQKLADRKESNSLRKLKCAIQAIDFHSNDYLGLATEHFELPQRNSLGATGSRLIAGNTAIHQQFEQASAQFHQAESTLLFNSGYDANLALFSTIPQKGDVVLYDAYIHNSIRQALRLSQAKSYKFQHNSIKDLKQKLTQHTGTIFIAVESVYSMDGDTCPLQDIVSIAKKFNACIMVDEAHSNGIYGKNGTGYVTHLGLEQEVDIRMMGMGKAIGRHGGLVLASETVTQYLINFASSFIYTTALSPHEVAQLKEVYKRLPSFESKRASLQRNIAFFKSLANNHPQFLVSNSPIQGFVIKGNDEVKAKATWLEKAGMNVSPILSPTVPKGSERIRICLHSFNTKQEITTLIKLLLE